MSISQSLPFFLAQFIRDYENDMNQTYSDVSDSIPDFHARIFQAIFTIIDKKPKYVVDLVKNKLLNRKKLSIKSSSSENDLNDECFLASPIRTYNNLSFDLIESEVCSLSSLLTIDDLYSVSKLVERDVIDYYDYNNMQCNVKKFIEYFFRCLKYEIEQTKSKQSLLQQQQQTTKQKQLNNKNNSNSNSNSNNNKGRMEIDSKEKETTNSNSNSNNDENDGPYCRKHSLRDETARMLEDNNKLRFEMVYNNSREESWIKLLALRDILRECLVRMPKQYLSRVLFNKKHRSLVAIRRVYENDEKEIKKQKRKQQEQLEQELLLSRQQEQEKARSNDNGNNDTVVNEDARDASVESSGSSFDEHEVKWTDVMQGNGYYVIPRKKKGNKELIKRGHGHGSASSNNGNSRENFVEFVFGGVCFRPFPERNFAEVVFLAIQSRFHIQGFGTRIMNHLKETLKSMNMFNILTYADNNAIEYFAKQGFHKCDEKFSQCCLKLLNPILFQNYIKHYEDATLMHCNLLYHRYYHIDTVPSFTNYNLNYCFLRESLDCQRKFLIEKLKHVSFSHVKRDGLEFNKKGKNGHGRVYKYLEIPGVSDTAWKPGDKIDTKLHTNSPLLELNAQLMIIWKKLHSSRHAWCFLEPVSTDTKYYHDIVRNPIDLSHMESKLINYQYFTHKQFENDFRVMIKNCFLFNASGSKYHRSAIKLEQLFNQLWQY